MNKKILAVVIAAIFIFSTMGTTVFAATHQNLKQYGSEGGYLAIGDSFTRGNGAYENNAEDIEALRTLRSLNGSYVRRVAEAVGCSTLESYTDEKGQILKGDFWNLSAPGMTLPGIFDIFGIEDGYYDDEFIHEYRNGEYGYYVEGRYQSLLDMYGDALSTQAKKDEPFGQTGIIGSARQLASDAKLITVELGMCDVFFRAVYAANASCGTEDITKLVTTAVENMYKGFAYWKTHYPILLKELRALNPDADIVMVGSTNMLFNAYLSDDILLPVGSAASAITGLMNSCYQSWASEKDGIYFADITNVDCGAEQYDWPILENILSDNYDEMVHPTPEGHAYIARQILGVLPEEEKSQSCCSTDIIVDLGRFDHVDYVTVNGKTVTDYSTDGMILTIPYGLRNATNLTIGVYRDRQSKATAWGSGNKTFSVVTYQLVYQEDHYTAYKLYTMNDTTGMLKKIAAGSKDLFDRISGLLKK